MTHRRCQARISPRESSVCRPDRNRAVLPGTERLPDEGWASRGRLWVCGSSECSYIHAYPTYRNLPAKKEPLLCTSCPKVNMQTSFERATIQTEMCGCCVCLPVNYYSFVESILRGESRVRTWSNTGCTPSRPPSPGSALTTFCCLAAQSSQLILQRIHTLRRRRRRDLVLTQDDLQQTSPASDCSTIGAATKRGEPIRSKKLGACVSLSSDLASSMGRAPTAFCCSELWALSTNAAGRARHSVRALVRSAPALPTDSSITITPALALASVPTVAAVLLPWK